jgi:hypothetical protein
VRRKLYDISTVKNALVKSVSYVTVFPICRLATGLSIGTETLHINVYLHILLVQHNLKLMKGDTESPDTSPAINNIIVIIIV